MKDEISNKRVEYSQELLERKRDLIGYDATNEQEDVQIVFHDKDDDYI
jgi:hypothetical protein